MESTPIQLDRLDGSEVFFRLAEASPIGIYIVQDGKFCFINREFRTVTGYSRRELVGKDCLALVHREDRNEVHSRAVEMLHGEGLRPYEYRVMRKDGGTRWILETVVSVQYRGRRAVAGNFMDITERRLLEESLRDKAKRDSLTGLLNHAAFHEELAESLLRKPHLLHSVVMADVDGLKDVNDSYGHQVGDEVLKAVAAAFERDGVMAGRYGGDEFVAYTAGGKEIDARLLCSKIESVLASTRIGSARGHSRIAPKVTFGIAHYPKDGQTVRKLIAAADSALYQHRRLAAGEHNVPAVVETAPNRRRSPHRGLDLTPAAA